MKISLVIITKNEEKNLKECIFSAKDIIDEIIIVDDFSTDNTFTIAQELNAIFIQKKLINFGEQKRFAVEQSSYDWILALDADERISLELKQSIQKIIAINKTSNSPDINNAYTFNRLNYYCGKAIKTCGWYPDNKIRLWNKHLGNWNLNPVHEGVEMQKNTRVGFLEGDLIHYTMNNIQEHKEKTKHYAQIKSQEKQQQHKIILLFKLLFNPIFIFIKMYIIKLGILDGWRGFSIARISAWGEYLIYKNAVRKIH